MFGDRHSRRTTSHEGERGFAILHIPGDEFGNERVQECDKTAGRHRVAIAGVEDRFHKTSQAHFEMGGKRTPWRAEWQSPHFGAAYFLATL